MEMINRCPQVELISINFIDKMLNTDSGIYLLCPCCATMTKFCDLNFDNDEGVFSCGCLNYEKRVRRTCRICKREPKEPVFFRVYDDDGLANGEMGELKELTFCDSHRLGWIAKFDRILLLSEVKEAVTKGLRSRTLNTGERVFTYPKAPEPVRPHYGRGSALAPDPPDEDKILVFEGPRKPMPTFCPEPAPAPVAASAAPTKEARMAAARERAQAGLPGAAKKPVPLRSTAELGGSKSDT